MAEKTLIGASPDVIHHSILALEKNTLRGMDTIHIGSALALQADVFISADQRQCAAAKLAGLQVAKV